MSGSGSAPQLDERALEAASRAGQKLALHWGHQPWSQSWADQVAQEVVAAYLAACSGAGELDLTDEAKLRIVHDKLIEKARIRSKLRPGDEWDFWLEARGILDALRSRLDRKDDE